MARVSEHGERGPGLHCLGGAPVPDGIRDCWRAFEALPDAGRRHVWDVLAPMLVAGLSDDVARASAAWCQKHGVAPPALERAIEACHFFLMQSARMNLDEARFREDLEAVSDAGSPCVEVLASRFGRIQPFLRQRIVEGSLYDHGRVFTGLDWRVDAVGASDRGLQIDLPVALLTLRHQEGAGEDAVKGRTTLTLLPEAVRELRRACEQIETVMASAQRRSPTRRREASEEDPQ